MRLKGWSMDLEEQRKGIQHVTKAAMETKTWRTDLWIEGMEGDRGTNGRSSRGTGTLPYVKQIASGNLLYESGSSNWGSVTNLEMGMGWGVEGEFRRERHIYIHMADSC